ncbi:uncharacterized protein TNCT_658531 [Trichonephila clavata]|uniref:Mutator-like transposase domain-containing protein n=1 Tax=Trichonephila clavata TaxID=2740835 RepID=A0A8X6L2J3_TRICU|nr:uncharacterized protein TNCT_658531 [Trichonephila clavata]
MSSKVQRRGSDYRRKRKRSHNNQYTRKVSDKLDVDCISASAKKLCKESDLDKEVRNSNQSNGYRLINIDILLSELSQYVTCPNCNTKGVLKEKILYGLVFEFYVECYSCSTLSPFKSSPVIASGNDYEVNTLITYAMRTVGQGFCGIKHFCTAMDLPPPVSQKAYEKILRKINLARCEVADDSMKKAAKEEILASGSNEICVSGDVTYLILKVLKMSTFGTDAFLQPVPDTLTYNATQIPVRTNFLERLIDEIVQLSYCEGFFWNKPYPLLLQIKKNPLELNPGNVVATQCSLVSPSNYAGMPDPGIDGPPKNNAVGLRPVERTIPWSRALLTVAAPQPIF